MLHVGMHTLYVCGLCVGTHEFSGRFLAGGDWSTFNTLSSWPRRDRASLYGSNDVGAGRPELLRMVAAYLCQPIYIVQVHPYVCINWCWYAVYMFAVDTYRQAV